MLAPPLVAWAILVLQLAVGVRDHRRRSALVWVALWLWLYESPERPPAPLRRGARLHRRRAGGAPARRRHAAVDAAASLAQRNFWGIALPRFLADPTWGTLTFWVPLYLTHGARLRSQADRAVRLAAVPGRGPRLPVRRRASCCGCRSAASASSTRAAGPSPSARCLMTGMAFVGVVESPYAAIALHLPGRLRAPDAVGHRHHHVLRPVQAERGGDGGGHGGHAAATLGVLRLLAADRRPGDDASATRPFFVGLACSTSSAPSVLWTRGARAAAAAVAEPA